MNFKNWIIFSFLVIFVVTAICFENLNIMRSGNKPQTARVSKVNEKVVTYVSLDSVIQPAKQIVPKTTKLLFGGDTMLSRTIGDKIRANNSPFKNLEQKFTESDYVILNLECVVSDVGVKNKGKLYTFRAPIESVDILKRAGVNIVSVANNHSMDYGRDAFIQMLELMKSNGINVTGGGSDISKAYEPLILDTESGKIALVSFNGIENYFTDASSNLAGSANINNKELLSQAMRKASFEADVVIPFLHWGVEYKTIHNSYQEQIAKDLIDLGADIVIGGHPHVKQDIGEYKGVKIYYSIGNLVFDQMPQRTDTADLGDLVEVVISNKTVKSTNNIPIKLDNEGIPYIL